VDLVPVPRRRILLTGGVIAAGAVLGGERAAAAAPDPEPLRRLLAGNRRYVSGASAPVRRTPADQGRARPFAIVLGCADSLVPAHVLFDQAPGQLVEIRVAGHAVDDLVLGSIEYALTDLSPALLMVLGHDRCGAVSVTVESIRRGAVASGHIATVVDALRPPIEPALRTPGEPVDNAVRANVGWQIRALMESSGLVRTRVGNGSLAVVGATSDGTTGAITLLTRGWR
jgi:carbonic anhydrase